MTEHTAGASCTGIDSRTMGVAVHRLLAELFSAGHRAPSPVELRRRVAVHPLADRPGVAHRQIAKQRLLVGAAIYLRFYAPPAEWRFLGAEVRLGRRRADLVWERDGAIMIDEIKSGAIAARLERDSLAEQVADLLRYGADEFGDHLIGVRAIVLAAPRSSYIARPDGTVDALDRGGYGE